MKAGKGILRANSPVTLVLIALATLAMGLGALPAAAHSGSSYVQAHFTVSAPSLARSAAVPAAHAAIPSPRASGGFPRTVLAEPFTELWCEWCPYESKGLYNLEHTYPSSYLIVAELHPCVTGNYKACDDSWPTLDGISDYRASAHAYNIQGYPTVEFDGGHAAVGALSTNIPTITKDYQDIVVNASAVPGNVSITQSAVLASGNMATVHETVLSDITGTYLALTYLTEHIDKNVSGTGGVHDVGNVVRASLINESVQLTAGQTTTISGSAPLNSTWNSQNLSAVALIQDTSTMVIENSNEVPVETVATNVVPTSQNITGGENTSVTVTVTNATSGLPLAGAQIAMTSSIGGTFSPMVGVSSSSGTFTSLFTAPMVGSTEVAAIGANVTQPGFVGGPSAPAMLTVNPKTAPDAPSLVTVASAVDEVKLTWAAPLSGAGGISYSVLRATSASGAFTVVGTTTTTSYVDTSVQTLQTYWYELTATDTGGVSPTTLAVTADAIFAAPSGLPPTVAWWVQIDSTVYNSTGDTAIALHVAAGAYTWAVGVDSYDYLPPQMSTGNAQLTDAPYQIAAAFAPNNGVVAGTVDPSGASVMLNGSAVTVSQGGFSVPIFPGTYPFVVSAPGYKTLSEDVVVTAGNTTTVPVSLEANPSSGSGSLGGMTGTTTLVLVGVAVVAVAAVAGLLVWSRKRRGSV